ncbi:MAG: putative toxin-antitoxin system toxin component, PIN family [Candidatus Atribacteria bacterium]|nr:putative toxin-antitoxin system toxin component, PIN family [Candidatus Atribacteria bacterium]
MIRVVIDTNVLISAFLFGGKPQEVLNLVIEKKIRLVTSEALENELYDVLGKKFKFSQEMLQFIRSEIDAIALKAYPAQKVNLIISNPNDNMVLECALAGKAHYIISGDRHHLLPIGFFNDIKIGSPSDFLKE